MMDEQAFMGLVREIQALGYDEETAGEYAFYIGDLIELDREGRTLVRDESGEIVARLKLD